MDLTTTYMGLALRNPLVASSSPLSYALDGVRRLADAGLGAVVLHSLFEEELVAEMARATRLGHAGRDSFAESLSYFPETATEEFGPRRYLNLLERAAAAVDIPVIASLNGVTPGGWTSYARSMQDAGAVAIECNVMLVPANLDISGHAIEQRHIEIVKQVKDTVTVPVAVKLTPYFSSIGYLARQLEVVGADGLVLFNRFMHPDVDPDSLAVVPGLGLSHPAEGRLARMWIALLRGRVRLSLAASTGVEDPEDVVKYLLAGADVVMTTASLLRHGAGYAGVLLDGLSDWMERKGFANLDEVRGRLAPPADVEVTSHERLTYATALRAANANPDGPW